MACSYYRRLERAQRIGKLGYWRANMKTGDLYWSDMIYEMFGVEKGKFEPTVEAFSSAVHPDDIELVRESERKAFVTGAYNRRYFDSRLHAIFQQVKTRHVLVAVATFDIDHFKVVNDTYGHAIGDTVLKGVVKIANEVFRSTDVFARTGGEEFTIIMENCTVEQAVERLEQLRTGIASEAFYNGKTSGRNQIVRG